MKKNTRLQKSPIRKRNEVKKHEQGRKNRAWDRHNGGDIADSRADRADSVGIPLCVWSVRVYGGGNAKEYALENVQPLENSVLKGKKLAFLGSSVTLGASSLHTSFADYIAVRAGAEYVKEAVSGTTLAGGSANSYIARMKKMDKNARFDLFVVQLSTNDATKKTDLGKVSGRGKEHDTKTVCGAIEYIIEYAEKTWNCPVVFYTNAYFESEEYAAMVQALKQIQEQYGIGVIDLYTDKEFNDISEEERDLYMADKIHPTQAGYLKWWTPKMEEYLNAFMTGAA